MFEYKIKTQNKHSNTIFARYICVLETLIIQILFEY